MSIGLWYVTLFCLGAGASLVAFWTIVLARGSLASLLGGQPGARGHVVAEMLTGALLVAGGAAVLVDHTRTWAIATTGLGLGALVYALAGSPGMYRGNKMMQAAFAIGWAFTIPAITLFMLNI